MIQCERYISEGCGIFYTIFNLKQPVEFRSLSALNGAIQRSYLTGVLAENKAAEGFSPGNKQTTSRACKGNAGGSTSPCGIGLAPSLCFVQFASAMECEIQTLGLGEPDTHMPHTIRAH